MPTAQRDFPYIWTTWLPRLLTGENSCEWAIWFKAHYPDWTDQPSDERFDEQRDVVRGWAGYGKRHGREKHGVSIGNLPAK